MRIGNNNSGMMQLLFRTNGNKIYANNPFAKVMSARKSGAHSYTNTIEDLRSGHLKNSYGVEGMNISRNKNWKRIINVSDEMKTHVLEDVKKDFYKYGGMTGDSRAEELAYFGKIHNYIKTVDEGDRSSAAWTLSQLHVDIADEVTSAVKAQIPGWTFGQQIPSDVLDKIFSSEKITSVLSGKSGGAKGIDRKV